MTEEALPSVLASDAERERACVTLREASVEGRLTLDEFGQRVERALSARTRDELALVTRDLPVTPRLSASARPPVRWLVAVLGGVERRGFWRIGQECTAVSFMGGCKIDLRKALISAPVTTIHAIAIMGGIDIMVPEGIEVDLAGITLLGGKDLRLDGPPPAAGAPLIRIEAFSLLGGLTVRDRPGLAERLFDAIGDRLRGS
jgi:hypothetical protein